MKRLLFLTLSTHVRRLSPQLPDYVPSNGLLGWWPFAGDAQDQSGNGHDGVVDRQDLPKEFWILYRAHKRHRMNRFFTLFLAALSQTAVRSLEVKTYFSSCI